MKNKQVLLDQLEQAGASNHEARELAQLAKQLSRLESVPIPEMTWERPARRVQIWLKFAVPTLACLVIGVVISALAQTAYPGSPLYALKRATENLALIADPSYRGVIMMRRADEVKVLVSHNQSQALIASTVASYDSDLSAYSNGQYADFEYCKNVLTQAETKAKGSSRAVITSALVQLSTHLDRT